MEEPNFQNILKSKRDYYGNTEAAIELAAEEFNRQQVAYSNSIRLVSKCDGCMGNGRRMLSTPGIGEVIVGKCKNNHSC